MIITRLVCILILGSLAQLTVFPQSKPPGVYIDKGACPFECCTYRTWKAEKDTLAFAQPNRQSKRVGTFKAGTQVVGLTGEVRTKPSAFTITKVHGKYRPGDVLFVYTPLGEGFYKVWFKGVMREEELDFVIGPFEQSYPRCEETPECWGRLEKPLQVEWWVKVRSRNGWIGWTDQPENFSNKDSCA